MAIAKMKKISLLALCKDRDDLLQRLLELGCVELSHTHDELSQEELGAFSSPSGEQLERARARMAKVEAALAVLSDYCPEKTGMFKVRKQVGREQFFNEKQKSKTLQAADEILNLSERVHSALSDEARLRSSRAALLPWAKLDVPLELESTARLSVIMGACPAGYDSAVITTTLAQEVEESELTLVHSDKQQHYFSLLCLKDKQNGALGVLRKFDFKQMDFKEYTGTAGENLARFDSLIAYSERSRADNTAKILSYKTCTSSLKLCWDNIAQDIAREEARQRLVSTQRVFQLNGWLQASDRKAVEKLLEEYFCVYELKEPEAGDNVPIQLMNNKLTRPFTLITGMYSMPSYGGIDPNAYIMPFFCIFFGMMFADMAYGLLVSLACFIIIKKSKPKGYLLSLMLLCGISSVVFGALSGSLFGNSVVAVAELFGVHVSARFWTKPLLDPLNDPITVLIVAYIFGFIHLMFGMAINAYMLIRDRKWKDAIFDVGAWWLLFAGVAVIVLGGTYWFAVAGAVLIVATAGRDSPGIGGKIGFGLFGLYNVTGYVGDLLSYTRLMTLMLASAVIANVVNILGSIAGNIFVFIPIFLIGHTLNIGINIIGTYVHTSRLIYLEFFSKFYREGGKQFTPLAINTKYVDIIKED